MTSQQFAAIIASGKAWNEHIRARKGNPEREKFRKTWSAPPHTDAEEQELRELEKEEQREEADREIARFLHQAKRKHQAYWAAHPHGQGGTQGRLFK